MAIVIQNVYNIDLDEPEPVDTSSKRTLFYYVPHSEDAEIEAYCRGSLGDGFEIVAKRATGRSSTVCMVSTGEDNFLDNADWTATGRRIEEIMDLAVAKIDDIGPTAGRRTELRPEGYIFRSMVGSPGDLEERRFAEIPWDLGATFDEVSSGILSALRESYATFVGIVLDRNIPATLRELRGDSSEEMTMLAEDLETVLRVREFPELD